MRPTKTEMELFRPWLEGLADGDNELLRLLWVSLGRIATSNLRNILAEAGRGMKMGDLPASKPLSGEAEVIAGWLKSAIENSDAWLDDLDIDGNPLRLKRCASYDDLIEEANADFSLRKWPLPGR